MTEYWPTKLGFEPDDQLLRTLGAVTWWALTVEDLAYDVGGLVRVRLGERSEPIGSVIAAALTRLDAAPQADAIASSATWLEDARACLDERNSILHGVTRWPIERNEDGGLAWRPVLAHTSRKSGNYSERPLTIDELSDVTGRLKSVYERHDDVWRDLTKHLLRAAEAASVGRRCLHVGECRTCEAFGLRCE